MTTHRSPASAPSVAADLLAAIAAWDQARTGRGLVCSMCGLVS